MPIPTDTFWNIKRLNLVFAISSVALLGVMVWSVVQDYDRYWRKPQRDARDWEAFMADVELNQALTDKQAERDLKELGDENDPASKIGKAARAVSAKQAQIDPIVARIRKLESEIATKEFSHNNLKSTLQVMEANYQEARAAGDNKRAAEMLRELKTPREQVAANDETIAAWKLELTGKKAELDAERKELDEAEAEKKKLMTDREALVKRREQFAPRSFTAHVANRIRSAPLMQFINPAEQPKQLVLADIQTEMPPLKVPTTDRCRTCHITIDDKKFGEDNLLAVLEKQTAAYRDLRLPTEPPRRPADPVASADKPGAAAMGDFWHRYAATIAPDAVRGGTARINRLAATVGNAASVYLNGGRQPLATFAYDPEVAASGDAAKAERQDAILAALIRAWAMYDPARAADAAKAAPAAPAGQPKNGKPAAAAPVVSVESGAVKVEIGVPADAAAQKAGADAHTESMKYPEELRVALESRLDTESLRLLRDRYRRALIREVNLARAEGGEPELEDSRVILAHPRMDLYVDVDSKHPMETLGCTGCHDGSGQETNFVLAAHMARPIWVDQKTGAPVLPQQLVNPPAHEDHQTLSSMLHAVFPEGATAPKLDLTFASDSAPAHGNADSHASTKESKESHHDEGAAGHGGGGGHAAHFDPEAPATEYVDPLTGERGRAIPQERYWQKTYERESGTTFKDVYHYWDWPMRPPQYLQANCARCHTQVTDIREEAPVLYEGRTLFANLGCVNCHQMDSIPVQERRQVGTDLRHVTSKLSPEFINSWIWAPKAFRPSTKMPHFFMLENNSSDEELRRTRQEALAITEYLVQTATPVERLTFADGRQRVVQVAGNEPAEGDAVLAAAEERPEVPNLEAANEPAAAAPAEGGDAVFLTGDAAAGRAIFKKVGCLACHTNLNDEVSKGVTVAQQWITTDLIKGGTLAARLEPAVAREVPERLARELPDKVKAKIAKDAEDALEKAEEKRLTAEVQSEMGDPPAAADPKKPTAEEKKAAADHKKKVTAEVKKRLKSAVAEKLKAAVDEAVKKNYDKELEKARTALAKDIERELPKELAKRIAAEAKAVYDGMNYNERELYVLEKFEPPSITMDTPPDLPVSPVAGEPTPAGRPQTLLQQATYPDGTPKPVFIHHGPELSGIGTKLLAGRKPQEARAWLFDWVKEPRHYSAYTVMPRLRLSDQQAADVVEYLLQQTRKAADPEDAWEAGRPEPDTEKLVELMALMLRSRYSFKQSFTKARDSNELQRLATAALTTPATDAETAASRAAKLSDDQRRLVYLGQKLIGHYGCMNCHAIHGTENFSSPCANLSDWGQKAITKLDYAYLDHHKHVGTTAIEDEVAVPLVNGLSVEAALLGHAKPEGGFSGKVSAPTNVHWPHVGHTRTDWIEQKLRNTRIYDRGKTLLEPALKPESDGEVRPEEVGKPFDKLKMPTFYLNDTQVNAIVTFVISNRDRLVTERMTSRATNERARQIAYGRYVAQKYNCVNCHETEGNNPPVRQYYPPTEVATKAPPSLRGEGNKIRHEWLFSFLRDVHPLRPLPEIRMPSFPLTDDETAALAAYFAAVSNKEAEDLRRWLDPIDKHMADEQKKSAGPVIAGGKSGAKTGESPGASNTGTRVRGESPVASAADDAGVAAPPSAQADPGSEPNPPGESGAPDTAEKPAKPAKAAAATDTPQPPVLIGPGDDWFKQKQLTGTRERLVRWALANGHISPLQLDPVRSKDELDRNYKTVWFKAKFTSDLYQAPYPFAEPPRSTVDESRFKRGEQMFYEMQCLQCHAMGGEPLTHDKPAKPGQTAPNLVLAHDRLQRRWVRRWVQEPFIIQVGTAMPPFFSGLPIFSLEGQSWPMAMPVGDAYDPANEAQRSFRAHVEQTYGPTVHEQTDLVLDFLFEAGARNYATTQPPAGARPPPESLPVGEPPTADDPDTAGDPAEGVDPSKAPVEKVPTKSPTRPRERPDADTPEKEPAPKETTTAKPPKSEPTEVRAPAGKVSVVGKVVFDGEPPEPAQIDMSGTPQCAEQHADAVFEESVVVADDGGLKNVVVFVSAGLPAGQEFPVPQSPAVLDQRGCVYSPHVLPMMVGQEIRVKNSDPFLHNVHTLPDQNEPINRGQPAIDPGMKVPPMKVPETFQVKCDVHPWMQCYWVVLEHPFFAASGADGSFALRGLPPGQYTLTAWHEKLGQHQAQVTVEEGKPAEANFTFAAQEANAADAAPARAVRVVTLTELALAAGSKAPACENCRNGKGAARRVDAAR